MAQEKKVRLNDSINVPEVRLIGADGEQAGVVAIADAQQAALDADLDLVEISPNAAPPVCRVMDYGKFLFEENKKKHAAKKKQKQTQVKEVKFRPGTDIGDYKVKLRNLIKFLHNGDRVKVTLRFRGREMAHQDLGAKLLDRVAHDVESEGHGNVEQRSRMEGRLMVMIISPKKT
ncbi:MAG: translation initiation factor IF-3 [Ectothiorhodospiraceae bacterium]|nr:translation initiation factor IF-3 [Ectothiorhodospiraceae bacterium]